MIKIPMMLMATTILGTTAAGPAGSGADLSGFWTGNQNFFSPNSNLCVVAPDNLNYNINDILGKLGVTFSGNLNSCIPNINRPDSSLPNTPDTDRPVQPDGDMQNASFAEQVAILVNKERAAAGLSELTVNTTVQAAAEIRAKEIVSSFSHTRPDGTAFSTALTEAGAAFWGAGENIAWGQSTPEEVMNAWMNSSGHRANILNKDFTSIGIGYYVVSGTPYWTQLFTY